jgi:ubiquinone/menaquinone biosynthesis C-methylase UbiE
MTISRRSTTPQLNCERDPFFDRQYLFQTIVAGEVGKMNNLVAAIPQSTNFIEELKTPKTVAMVEVLRNAACHPQNILVVGCGSGAEAGIFARAFGAHTIGIDIVTEFTFDHSGAAPAMLMQMDARALTFADQTFDLVYSFHAIEHIPAPKAAISEMSRVLRSGGRYLIGTPNKSRMLGYFAAAHPLSERIMMNLSDIRMRLRGRWTNEAGAHAGFTTDELTSMCRDAFGESSDISEEYYSCLYRSKERLVKQVCRSPFRKAILPCVYASGRKQS